MPLRETHSTFDLKTSLPPLLRSAGTANGTGVDLAGFYGNAILIVVGALTDGTHVPTIEESDSSGSGYTTVAAADLVGTLANLAANTNQKVAYRGSKRYVRVVITTTGGSTGANASAVVLRDRPRTVPQ